MGQWLHFVFPRDCPFPHKSNSFISLSDIEFGLDDYEATEKEMHETTKLTRLDAENFVDMDAEIPHEKWVKFMDGYTGMWSNEEELLAEHLHRRKFVQSLHPVLRTLRVVLCIVALLSVLVVGALRPAARFIAEARESGILG